MSHLLLSANTFQGVLNAGFIREEDENPGLLRGHEEQVPLSRGSHRKDLADSMLEPTCTSL